MLSDIWRLCGAEFQFPRVRINSIVYVCLHNLEQIIAVADRLTVYEQLFYLTMLTPIVVTGTKALNNE